jgi:hypothetical protein
MGEEESAEIVRHEETQTSGKEYFQGRTGGIHSLHLYGQHKENEDLAEIFVMYLAGLSKIELADALFAVNSKQNSKKEISDFMI